jgi:hypothetical protein
VKDPNAAVLMLHEATDSYIHLIIRSFDLTFSYVVMSYKLFQLVDLFWEMILEQSIAAANVMVLMCSMNIHAVRMY